ncbi:MAG TPA: CopD family protein [Caulobacteraceae bacterium]
MIYDLLRGLHILAVIAWMAGLLYLPRLFAYHSGAALGSEMDETFKTMERKLLQVIMNPAMVAVVVLAGALMWIDGAGRMERFLFTPWVIIKLSGGVFLLGWHHYLARARKAFASGLRPRSARFWRMTNELPFIVAIVMVLAVTTRLGG